jgi:hypothetical protein
LEQSEPKNGYNQGSRSRATHDIFVILNLIIHRDRLEPLFKNLWEEFQEEYGSDPTVWHDQFLVRFGVMNLPDINLWLSYFEKQG